MATKTAPDGKKKGSSMQDAVSGTEAIRTWDDHRIGIEALCRKFKTNKDTGLTSDGALEAKKEYGDNALS